MQPVQDIQQTPINDIHNADVLHLMRKDAACVAEVGSSSGALARAYREINSDCRYVGIEIVEEYAQASKRYCTDVICGNVEKLDDEVFNDLSSAQSWVFADALEHLYDPWKLLKKIRQNASGPVEVVACVPNAQNWSLQTCLNTGRFVYQDSGLLDRTHIRWFTRLTLIDLFHSSGFQIVDMRARIFHQPDPQVLAAIGQLAQASGVDPEQAKEDAVAFQYVVKAVAEPVVDQTPPAPRAKVKRRKAA